MDASLKTDRCSPVSHRLGTRHCSAQSIRLIQNGILWVAVGIGRCTQSIAQERTVAVVIPDGRTTPVSESAPVRVILICVDSTNLTWLHQKRWEYKNMSIVVSNCPTRYLNRESFNILKCNVFIRFTVACSIVVNCKDRNPPIRHRRGCLGRRICGQSRRCWSCCTGRSGSRCWCKRSCLDYRWQKIAHRCDCGC